MIDFSQLAIIFIFSFSVALIFKFLKQPLIISYLLTGVILSSFILKAPEAKNIISIFSDLGVAFLLFVVGLELKLKTIRDIGFFSVIIGCLQEILTILVGFLIAKLLGFSFITSLYLAIALSFSSTIIMVKLITDKGDLEKFYGKLAVGFLLVQDLIAILILFFLPIFAKYKLFFDPFRLIFGLACLFLVPFFAIKFLSKIENFLAKSQELLFLFSIAFGLGIGSLFEYLGFGLEAGALIAGISLSNFLSSPEIVSKLKPLRDFFLILFFVLIGSEFFIGEIRDIILPAIVLSIFVLIGNPLLMLLLLGPLGYKSRISFLLGLTSAQISEFSFLLIGLGIELGHLNQEILSLTSLIGLITIFFSSYLFVYAERIYVLLSKYLKILERKDGRLKIFETPSEKTYDIILFGCDRTGKVILDAFKKISKKFLIVDYNPEILKNLKKEGYFAIYGDAEDIDFLNELDLENAKLVISTIPDYETNLLILREYRRKNPDGIFMTTSYKIEDALDFYKENADYVIMPHFLGGEYVKEMIEKFMFDKSLYEERKAREIEKLKQRMKFGN